LNKTFLVWLRPAYRIPKYTGNRIGTPTSNALLGSLPGEALDFLQFRAQQRKAMRALKLFAWYNDCMATRESWYNGWSWKERTKLGNIATKAYLAGNFSPPAVCALCKLQGVIKGKESPHLMFHMEDYSRPLECVVICVECHFRLHRRFSFPNRWRRHCEWIRQHHARPYASVYAYMAATAKEKQDIGRLDFKPDPTRWWENLSYDPALKQAVEPGVRIILQYGADNSLASLKVSVVRDELLVTQPRLF